MLDRSADLVQTLDEYIYPAIQKQYVAILTHETDVIDDGDVEAVHQMRVNLLGKSYKYLVKHLDRELCLIF